MDEGNFITDAQNRSFSKIAVLGSTAKLNLFDNAEAIGKQIKINSNTYTVVGIAKSKGGAGFTSPDENIFIPLNTAIQYITGNNTVGSIAVTTAEATNMAQLQEDITNLLISKYKIKNTENPGFRIFNQADLQATASSITSIFTILLGSVAGISLVVGGIGIMNMMLTTVRERTKEIGLRKAIGAQKKDIQTQFLVEAVFITVSGGVIGILLGYGVSYAITLSGVITTSVSVSSVLLSFGVSVFIGIVFGFYPARKAAQLNPIDALRYE
jgi:putative ABC transport system permease protein